MNKDKKVIVGLVIVITILLVGGVFYIGKNSKEETKLPVAENNLQQQNQVVDKNVCSPTTAWMKVISPNGGEVYRVGETINITWKDCNFPTSSEIGIGLRDTNRPSGKQDLIIARGISLSYGTYSFVIPATINAYGTAVSLNGTNSYYVDISDGMSGGGSGHIDSSDAAFSITR